MTKKEFVVILIFTFIVFLAWVVSDLIRTPPSEITDQKLKKAVEPLNSSLDLTTINLLEKKEVIKTSISNTTPLPLKSTITATASANTQ